MPVLCSTTILSASMLGLICSFIPHLCIESLQCVGCYGHGSELERQIPVKWEETSYRRGDDIGAET